MKKKLLIVISLLLVMNAFSCEEKNEVNSSEIVTESSDEPLTVSLATFYNPSKTEKNLISKMSEQNIDVDIRFYASSDTSDASEMLNLDMISGDCPDVLCLPAQNMQSFIKMGYMTDLYPLLKNSPTLSQKDFLPNVLSGLDIDGKLPAICDGFILETAVAKSEIVGNDAENWTPQQALDLLNTMPEKTDFLKNTFRPTDVSYYLTECLAVEAVANRNFDGEYRKMLDFIAENPEIMGDEMTEFSENGIIREVTIFGINNSVSIQVFADFQGENVTFVGYPSENGKGYLTEANDMFGIPETCPNKAEAFEVISLMMTDISANSYLQMGVPALEKRIENDLKVSKYTQSSINCPVNIGDEEVQMPAEKIQQVLDYIRRIDFEPYRTNWEISAIIRQEFNKFLHDEITAEECSDTLNNRISLYLSETN